MKHSAQQTYRYAARYMVTMYATPMGTGKENPSRSLAEHSDWKAVNMSGEAPEILSAVISSSSNGKSVMLANVVVRPCQMLPFTSVKGAGAHENLLHQPPHCIHL